MRWNKGGEVGEREEFGNKKGERKGGRGVGTQKDGLLIVKPILGTHLQNTLDLRLRKHQGRRGEEIVRVEDQEVCCEAVS